MGDTVYDSNIPVEMGAHVYAHSRKDGKYGIAYLVINNSRTDNTVVELPSEAEVYLLKGKTGLRSRTMLLNDTELVLDEHDNLPPMEGVKASGSIELEPGNCAFILL